MVFSSIFDQLNHDNQRATHKPLIMGILNITPDSFYDGGNYTNETSWLKRTEQIIEQGGSIIDIGAFSTRPGAENVTEHEEWSRLAPVLKSIKKNFAEITISVDTWRASIASKAINEGIDIINDISGGTMDADMFEVVEKSQTPYILMHIQGTPQDMQSSPNYRNVTEEVKQYFSEKIEQLEHQGFSKIILDPGFGFGKNVSHNYKLLNNLNEFKQLGYPVLVGISRKSMINKVLNITPSEALNGTTVLNTIALINGADILRVHDVKQAVESAKIIHALIESSAMEI